MTAKKTIYLLGGLLTITAIALGLSFFPSSDGNPPEFSFEAQLFKGQLSDRGLLSFENSDLELYNSTSWTGADEVQVKAGLNYYYTESDMPLTTLTKCVNPQVGKMLFVYYSPGEGSLSQGYHLFPSELASSDSYGITRPGNFVIPSGRIFGLYAKNQAVSHCFKSAEEKSSVSVQNIIDTQIKGWYQIAADTDNLAQAIAPVANCTEIIWPQTDATGAAFSTKLSSPAEFSAYSFTNYFGYWVRIGECSGTSPEGTPSPGTTPTPQVPISAKLNLSQLQIQKLNPDSLKGLNPNTLRSVQQMCVAEGSNLEMLRLKFPQFSSSAPISEYELQIETPNAENETITLNSSNYKEPISELWISKEEFPDMKLMDEFKVKVRAIMGTGDSAIPSGYSPALTVNLKSGSSCSSRAKPLRPRIINIKEDSNSRGLTISFEQQSQSQFSASLQHKYIVRIFKGTFIQAEITVDSAQNKDIHLMASQLPPDAFSAQYSYTIQSFDDVYGIAFFSDMSAPYDCKLGSCVRISSQTPGQVSNLQARLTGNKKFPIELKWDYPDYPSGRIVGYHVKLVKYDAENGDEFGQKYVTVITDPWLCNRDCSYFDHGIFTNTFEIIESALDTDTSYDDIDSVYNQFFKNTEVPRLDGTDDKIILYDVDGGREEYGSKNHYKTYEGHFKGYDFDKDFVYATIQLIALSGSEFGPNAKISLSDFADSVLACKPGRDNSHPYCTDDRW